ncbi:MAG: phosphoglucosamine mutase [Acidimicrobiia bacterium]|nr:MAG: phosphoglucosamine mutase [Acidimicrobiia bacterium]
MEDETQRLFGTDGVRGVANSELTPELAFNLARAAGDSIQGHVVIGRDPRRSSPMLASATAAGFNAVGIDTVDLGILPVGAVSRLTRDTGAVYGIMISASHNPAEDNGIKLFGKDGAKIPDGVERSIEMRYFSEEPFRRPVARNVGIQTTMHNAVDRYVDKVSQTVSYSMRGLEFVVDCANGAAFLAAPQLFEAVGSTVEIMADTPDGMNINDGVGATHPEAVAARSNGKVGLAFDGDADRLIAVDEDGEIVNGDVIMAIFARWQHERGKLEKNTVVATVMSNLGFLQAMERLGIDVVLTPVGDRHVVEAMRRTRAVVGGEQSGHILLEDRSTGDGLRTALRLMEVMAATGKELRELRGVMSELPQVLTNVKVVSKNGWQENTLISKATAQAEAALGNRGRVLVRPSGTEPLIRVMVEAPTESEAASVAESIADVVSAELA